MSTEALLSERDTDGFSGVRPSPDGRLLELDTSMSTEALPLDYPTQMFSRTGYPMWASQAIFRAQLLDARTGKSTLLPADTALSWGGSWSPDGQQYAFYSDRGGMAAVWIWDRNTGRTRLLNDAVARMFRSDDRPAWTPDGKRLIYKVVPEGMTLKDLETFNDQWRRIAAKPVATSVSVHVYDASDVTTQQAAGNGVDWYNYSKLADLASVDVQSGQLTRVARRLHPVRFSVSPDGSHAGVLNWESVIPNTQRGRFSLRVYSLRDGAEKILASDVVPADQASFSWSPNGDRVAYATYGGEHFDRWTCFVVALNSGQKLELKPPAGEKFTDLEWGAPLWSRDGTRLFELDTPAGFERAMLQPSHLWSWRSDGSESREIGQIPGRRIEDIVRDSGGNTYWSPGSQSHPAMILRTTALESLQDGFFELDLGADRVKRIGEYDARVQKPLTGADSDHKQFAFLQSDAGHSNDVFVLDVASGRTRQLSHLQPALETVAMGKARLIDWLSPTGEHLRGALLLPPGVPAGTRLPLVVWVYGGSHGSAALNKFGFGWGTAFNMQMLATRRFAVLFPDVPLHEGRPVQDVVDAVLSGVNRTVELGIADPERLAVMGQSFGGYNTQSLITHTTRFKAAIMTGSASADLFAAYPRFEGGVDVGTGYYEHGQGGMGGATPWEMPVRYFENSPSFLFDRVQTPLLIVQGMGDWISSASSSTYNSLRRLGKPVQLLQYDGEGHVLQQPANVIDVWNRRIAWLTRYLDTQEPPPAH